MSKGKKIYCIASFAFACAVLILTITLCMMHPGRVYASSMDPDSITKITQKDTQGADHNTDNVNGLSITYNNDSGIGFHTDQDASGVDNSITCTIDSDYDDFVYTNYHCTSFP